jgi:hypothetical protein
MKANIGQSTWNMSAAWSRETAAGSGHQQPAATANPGLSFS